MPRESANPAVRNLIDQYNIEARAYFDHWAPVIHPIACQLVARLRDENVERVLDMGAGAGLLLPVLQKKFARAYVVGADRSEGMIALAGPRAALAMADAGELGIRTGVFDLVVMAFMLFHLPDPSAGLAEIRRVLRPGGVLGLTTWANDLASPAIDIWNEELDAQGAIPGVLVQRLACHELMDSAEKVRGLLETAGYVAVNVEVKEFTHQMDPEAFIRLRTTVGSTKKRFDSLDEDARKKCVERARGRLSKLSQADFLMRMAIVLGDARSPQ